ncbi:MAG: glutathione peroxidase [Methanobacteriaceae archaeon]
MSVYEYDVKDINGNTVSMKEYENKVLLIVNTASKCGFTPQYEGLQELYEKYNSKGFEVLDFPCNQFGSQAKGTNEELANFCQTNFNVKFKTFAKIDVNGPEESPLFTFLKKETKGFLGSKIKWNFTKFLVDREGNVLKRYSSTTKPKKIEKDILKLIS